MLKLINWTAGSKKRIQTLAVTFLLAFGAAAGEEIRLSEIYASPAKGAGVAVSPSHVYLSVTPGQSKSTKITVNNDTDKPNKFMTKLQDFDMDKNGRSVFLPRGMGDNSLADFISISPSFIELQPGQKKDIVVTVSIPEDHPDAYRASWSIMMVEQAIERKQIDQGESAQQVSFGIYPTFAFGVFLYQNPPNVKVNAVEIVDFKIQQRTDKNFVQLDVQNVGDGITSCRVRVELLNNTTGESVQLPLKNFTIIPELKREFKFVLPTGISEGEYTAIGVVDYGSDDEILTAELDFQY